MSIENLSRILIPPLSPIEAGRQEEWDSIEERLGIKFPTDYHDFITTFGTGYVGDFIWIFNPFAQKPTMNLLKQIPIRIGALKEIKQQFPSDVPFALFPEGECLLPCGATGNGDCLYWLTKGSPDKWPILVNESRGPDWETFDMQLTDFLARILKREIVCNIFPPDFPNKKTRSIREVKNAQLFRIKH